MRAPVSLLVVLAACSGPGASQPHCRSSAGAIDTLLTAGVAARLNVRLSVDCAGTAPGNVTATVDVVGPAGQRARSAFTQPHLTFTATDAGFAGTVATTVLFTPNDEGAWQIDAEFSPALGRSHVAVRTVDRRIDAGTRILVEPGGDCWAMNVTDLGGVLCLRRPDTPRPSRVDVAPYGQGFEVDSLAGVSVRGDAVWLIHQGMLTRYADDGVSLIATHARAVTDLLVSAMVAIDDGAWLMGSDQLLRLRPLPDGGLDRQLWATSRSGAWLVPHPDGALVLAGFRVGFVAADGGTTFANLEPTAMPAAFDDERIWVLNEGTLSAWGATPGGNIVRGRAEVPIEQPFTKPSVITPKLWAEPGYTPVFPMAVPGRAVVVPRMVDGDIHFERYEPGDGFEEPFCATPRHVFARSNDHTQVKVFER